MKRIEIYDTTLRDGAQAEGISFSLFDKLELTKRLDEIGFDFVEGGYPASNEKDAQYFQQVRDLGLRRLKVCAFGMTRRRNTKPEEDAGLRALIDSQAATITLVGKSSAFQATEVLQTTLAENLRMIADSVAFLKDAGREVIYDAEHFFDGYKANPDYALQTLQAAVEAGADWVVLCDTNGGSLPFEVEAATCDMQEQLATFCASLDRPRPGIGIHTHNDSGLALANAL
ncbi:MAG: citramalate synthase, partial [Thermoguttaceae bacterium]